PEESKRGQLELARGRLRQPPPVGAPAFDVAPEPLVHVDAPVPLVPPFAAGQKRLDTGCGSVVGADAALACGFRPRAGRGVRARADRGGARLARPGARPRAAAAPELAQPLAQRAALAPAHPRRSATIASPRPSVP